MTPAKMILETEGKIFIFWYVLSYKILRKQVP